MCTHCESMATLSDDNQDSSYVLTLQAGRCLTSAPLLFLQQQYRCHCHNDVQPRSTCQHPASVGLLAVRRSDTCHVSSASNQTIPWFRPILTVTELLRCCSCSSTQNTILKTPWVSFNQSVDLCPLFRCHFQCMQGNCFELCQQEFDPFHFRLSPYQIVGRESALFHIKFADLRRWSKYEFLVVYCLQMICNFKSVM